MLNERVDAMTDTAEQAATLQRLDWCERYSLDATRRRSDRVPNVKPAGYSGLAEFRQRLGFGGHR
ncbi:hypothetical protein [Mycolicibacterium sp. YH-1]|uniref:hypothetical protein n=1 Tax=Mycolicibacterium sp. YH-1 TaxID=2908837 RepID=UPI001F4BF3AC|nr:hypothetical protein [Mycolicibacterium sp. YH-1]UNB52652.1 hypothetical protein L0M16_33255 [Mycolicibacterium sp. YH-1]